MSTRPDFDRMEPNLEQGEGKGSGLNNCSAPGRGGDVSEKWVVRFSGAWWRRQNAHSALASFHTLCLG